MKLNDFRAINGLSALFGFALVLGGVWNRYGLDAACILFGFVVIVFSLVGSRV